MSEGSGPDDDRGPWPWSGDGDDRDPEPAKADQGADPDGGDIGDEPGRREPPPADDPEYESVLSFLDGLWASEPAREPEEEPAPELEPGPGPGPGPEPEPEPEPEPDPEPEPQPEPPAQLKPVVAEPEPAFATDPEAEPGFEEAARAPGPRDEADLASARVRQEHLGVRLDVLLRRLVEIEPLLGQMSEHLDRRLEAMDARLGALEHRIGASATDITDAASRLDESSRAVHEARATIEEQVRDLSAAIGSLTGVVDEALPELQMRQRTNLTAMASLADTLRASLGTLESSIDQRLDSLGAWRERLAEAGEELSERVARSVDEARRELIADAERSTMNLAESAQQVRRVADALDRLDARVGETREVARTERMELLREVLEVLVESLPPRQRKRIADEVVARIRAEDEAPVAGSSETLVPVASGAARSEVATATSSELERLLNELPGLGPARRRTLAGAFASPEEMARASISEIASLPGITLTLAADLRGQLRDRLMANGDDDGHSPTEVQ